VLRYRIEGDLPPHGSYVVIAAPHTSWLDLPLMLGGAWSSGFSPVFLGKKELFKAPFGGLLRKMGGIPVDRQNPAGLVDEMIARAGSGADVALVIAPEGTRRRGKRWKSGFYRIATGAQVPVLPSYVDGPTRTIGFGPPLRLTGDVKADMDVFRAFYAGKRGVHPDLATPPLLAEETRDAPPAPAAGDAAAA
jgi:1-acyl-sn-glycerol-3-phosphate acyltransferase